MECIFWFLNRHYSHVNVSYLVEIGGDHIPAKCSAISLTESALRLVQPRSVPIFTDFTPQFSRPIFILPILRDLSAYLRQLELILSCFHNVIEMSVGFGFAVGDFIAGLQLVREVISSLQSSAGSVLEYHTLISELFTLERALLEVKALRYEDCEATQLDALKCAATQCQSTIDRFLAKIKKYQPSLNAQGSTSKVKDGFRKIQWALCEKSDLEVFKAEVRGHAGSINLLLATIQM